MKEVKTHLLTTGAVLVPLIPTLVTPFAVAATEVQSPFSNTIISYAANLEEGRTYTLQEIADILPLSKEEKEKFIQDSLETGQGLLRQEIANNSFRSLQTTVLQRLSHAQVQDAVNSDDPVGFLSGSLNFAYSALAYFELSTFKTAARNGWGLEWVITVDPHNPTSTGMTFSWRFVK